MEEARFDEEHPGLVQRLGYLLEIVLFLTAVLYLDALPAELGIHIDPEKVDGVRLLAVSLITIPLVTGLLALTLRLRDQTLRDIGLAPPPLGWPRTVAGGLLAAFALFPVVYGITLVLSWSGFEFAPGDLFHRETFLSRLGFLFAIPLRAGFGEELLFRGYLFRRLQAMLEGFAEPRVVMLVAAMISSILFALPHGYQGGGGVITVFLIGMAFCWLAVQWRGNLWGLIIAHTAYDLIAISLL